MFGLFRSKAYEPTVNQQDKDWIEQNIAWFIENFGLDKLRTQPFIVPGPGNFPYDNLKNSGQFQQLFEQLCTYYELDPGKIDVLFFDDLQSRQWGHTVPHGDFMEPLGLYEQVDTAGQQRFRIQLAKSNLETPLLLVSVLAHELAHVKLLGGGYISINDAQMEPLTDLAAIFFGFGVIIANSVQILHMHWINRVGYLPFQLISYTNALVCYITEHDADNYYAELNTNTRDLFKKDYEYLVNTGDTLLTKFKLAGCEAINKAMKQIQAGFKCREFHQVIEAADKLLEMNPKAVHAINNKGYALLLQKKYREAIAEFDRLVDIDPYYDYAFNNRGYCKLQLGELEDAYIDLQSSFVMNPYNSFSHRTLGAYCLKKAAYEKALQYFEEAEKIDPQTEMINFYLGQAHLKLGNRDTAEKYLAKSKELDEYDDTAGQV